MMAIGLILLFHVPMGLENTGKIIYAALTYVFVAAFAYTASNLSYNALLSLMTDDQQTRASASTIRFICTMLTAITRNHPAGREIWLGHNLCHLCAPVSRCIYDYLFWNERTVCTVENR